MEDPGVDQQRAHVRAAFSTAADEIRDLDATCPRDGRTTDYTYLEPDERRMVWVYSRSMWHGGELRAFRRRGDRWEGDVVWSEGIGRTYTDWLPQDRIQPLAEPGESEAQG